MLSFPRSSQRSRRAASVPALALLAAGAITMAGCVSSGLYTQVEQERDILRADNEKLKSQVEEANRLAQERSALASEKSALEEKLASLQAQQSTLGAKLRESEDESKKLQSTYDGLVKDLKKELEAGQVQVQQLRDGLRVNLSQDILFDSGSAALDKNGTRILGKVATQLKKSSHQILVIGHTDNKQIRQALARQYPTNWELGGARAASVVRLFAHSGLSSKRMNAVSVADAHPVASNKTEDGRSQNRRIEIRLRPIPRED